MKRLFFTFMLILTGTLINAQYSTPGTGVNWSLDDLVQYSQGAVTIEISGQYNINQNIIVSANDTLSILLQASINMMDEVLVTIQGTMIASPPLGEIVFFKAFDNYFQGFRFDNSVGSMLWRTYFKKAGGVKLVSSDVSFFQCDFADFNQDYTSGTIDLFQSSPIIYECNFTNNQGPAIMSSANGSSSPQIIACSMSFNVAANVNMPQINLGTSAESDSIRIVNCSIIGNRANIMAGGIAVTTLAGGNLNARIQGNIIRDNRYGITVYGNNIGSVIIGNEIVNNDTQGLPMLGGSGINFFGNTSNQSLVASNIITGNLWGITIQQQAQPNFGQLEGNIYNPGENQIFGNGNQGEVYDLYNNTPNPIMAQNNWWGSADPDSVEMSIFHQYDDPSLGLVTYLPLFNPPVAIHAPGKNHAQRMKIYPNPATTSIKVKFDNVFSSENTRIEFIDASGKLIETFRTTPGKDELKIEIPNSVKGVVFIRLKSGSYAETQKVIVH